MDESLAGNHPESGQAPQRRPNSEHGDGEGESPGKRGLIGKGLSGTTQARNPVGTRTRFQPHAVPPSSPVNGTETPPIGPSRRPHRQHHLLTQSGARRGRLSDTATASPRPRHGLLRNSPSVTDLAPAAITRSAPPSSYCRSLCVNRWRPWSAGVEAWCAPVPVRCGQSAHDPGCDEQCRQADQRHERVGTRALERPPVDVHSAGSELEKQRRPREPEHPDHGEDAGAGDCEDQVEDRPSHDPV